VSQPPLLKENRAEVKENRAEVKESKVEVKENRTEVKETVVSSVVEKVGSEKQKMVHLPEIKKKKESMEVFNPKLKNKNEEAREYYSYKSPNFKQN
jgi:hypothetical protein